MSGVIELRQKVSAEVRAFHKKEYSDLLQSLEYGIEVDVCASVRPLEIYDPNDIVISGIPEIQIHYPPFGLFDEKEYVFPHICGSNGNFTRQDIAWCLSNDVHIFYRMLERDMAETLKNGNWTFLHDAYEFFSGLKQDEKNKTLYHTFHLIPPMPYFK